MTIILEHVNITVKSFSAATRLIGAAFPSFTIRGRGYLHEDATLGEWIHFGDDCIYVAFQKNADHSGRHDTPYTHDGINHIGFVVDDLELVVSRLHDAGFEPTSVDYEHPHRKRIYYQDDNGIEWEFVEYLSALTEEINDYNI